MSKTVLVINCEHTSITQQYLQGPDLRRSNAINAERWWVNGSDKLASITLDAYKTFGVSVLEGMFLDRPFSFFAVHFRGDFAKAG